MKNSNNTIGNRTRDPPACRTMPQSPRGPGATYALANNFLSRSVFQINDLTGKYIFFFLSSFCEGQTAYIEVKKDPPIPSLWSLLEFDLP